jgi:LPXTG-site transpeptidase (sortase) family protein
MTKISPILKFCIILLGVSIFLPISKVVASSLQQSVPYEVLVNLQLNPTPSYIEQTVTATVTVTTQSGLGGPVNGVVELRSGQSKFCTLTLDASGQATCTLIFDTPSTVEMQAVYLGVTQYLPGVSPRVTHRVLDKHVPLVQILSDLPDPSIINRQIVVNFQAASVGPIPSGAVTVYRGDAACIRPLPLVDTCSASLDSGGHGSCTLPLSVVGQVNLCAAFAGDYANYAAVSAPEIHRVSQSNTFTQITNIVPSPSLLGESVAITFTVTSPDGIPQNGLVTVISGTSTCSATIAVGHCSLAINQAHLNPVYASYAGETVGLVVLQPSTSDVVLQRVNVPPSDISMDSNQVKAYSMQNEVVAAIQAVDANVDENHTFALVDGVGAGGNAYFWIDGDQLKTQGNIPVDPSRISIRIRATDPAGLIYEETFTLVVIENTPLLPNTGFAPWRITLLPHEQIRSTQTDQVTLEIPKLLVKIPVVGVPLENGTWQTDFLFREAGWLHGTAFPGWQGNSLLAAHNFLPSGLPGPFWLLGKLTWNDTILIHAFGETSVYKVRSVSLVIPDDPDVMQHEEDAWLTLVTCKSFDETTQSYRWRVVVKAELVEVR